MTALALVQVVAVAIFLAVGSWRPRVDGELFHRDLWLNLATGALLFVIRVTAIAWLTQHVSVGLVDLSALPSVVSFVICFLGLDFLRYAVHWADHRVPFLWSFHRVHHSSERLDATSGLRMHLVDFLQLSLLPIVLFSVLLDTSAVAAWVVPTVLAVGMVSDAWQHANIRIDARQPLFRAWNTVLNNPHFHSWHHVRDHSLGHGNYGQTLVVWDRLFGTAVDRDTSPESFGLSSDDALVRTTVGLQLLRRGEL
jgi:sterol desaturase/sphingolipid hydroxylase (fatty acid hydroxylase superfamily)